MKKERSHINKNKRLALSLSNGFSLVELLVSISIFLIFVLAISSVLSSVLKGTRNSLNRERATMLAEEALEATRNIRDSSIGFANLPDGTYGLSTSSNIWNLSGTSDITDIFTRALNISTISGNQKKVVVDVSWADQISENNSITFKTYLTNWRAPLNMGLTLDKVVINHGGTKMPSDFLPYDLSTLVWDNSVEPPIQNLVNIPIIFSPSTMKLVSGTYNFTTTNDPDYNLTLSTDCGGGSIILNDGDTKLCTITYEENNPTSTIAFIGSSTSSGTIATIPSHQVGDLLIAFAYRDGNASAPALASGWTNISSSGGGNANASRLAYRIATGSDSGSGWSNATAVIVQVYRGQSANPIGVNRAQAGSGTTVTYPALSLNVTSGTSWVIGFAGHRSINTDLQNSPTGMTQRATRVDSVAEVSGHDTNSGVSSWGAQNVSVGGTGSGWMTRTLEIKSN